MTVYDESEIRNNKTSDNLERFYKLITKKNVHLILYTTIL